MPAIVAARARGGDDQEHHSLALLESGLEWDYVTELRERWKVPVIVKGLVTAKDAILACDHGASGVVVSNHGGRQLDGAIASLEALPEVVEAVGDRAEVFVDGGVRRGSDVVMALALGARAVLLGRHAMYGLPPLCAGWRCTGSPGAAQRESRRCSRSSGRRPRTRSHCSAAARPARSPRPTSSRPSSMGIAELTRNAVHLLPAGALEAKLALGRPLRVKLGIDVTSPDIHARAGVPP